MPKGGLSVTCTRGLAYTCSEGLSIDSRLERDRNIKTPFCNAPVRLLPLHSCLVCFVEKLILKSFHFNNICKLLRRALASSVQFIFLHEISNPTSLHLVICSGLCDWSNVLDTAQNDHCKFVETGPICM